MSEEQQQREAWEASQATAAEHEIERIFREHHAMVFRAAWRITGNAADAEDVLQTVFLRLVRRRPDAGPMLDPGSYLRRAAVNAALDVVRLRQAARTDAVDEVGPLAANEAGSPARLLSGSEIRGWLRAAVARLSPQAAEIFALRFFEGKENPEIAAELGTTPGTVAVTLHRARQRLLEEFKEWMGGRSES